jgi:hypothetical protein
MNIIHGKHKNALLSLKTCRHNFCSDLTMRNKNAKQPKQHSFFH